MKSGIDECLLNVQISDGIIEDEFEDNEDNEEEDEENSEETEDDNEEDEDDIEGDEDDNEEDEDDNEEDEDDSEADEDDSEEDDDVEDDSEEDDDVEDDSEEDDDVEDDSEEDDEVEDDIEEDDDVEDDFEEDDDAGDDEYEDSEDEIVLNSSSGEENNYTMDLEAEVNIEATSTNDSGSRQIKIKISLKKSERNGESTTTVQVDNATNEEQGFISLCLNDINDPAQKRRVLSLINRLDTSIGRQLAMDSDDEGNPASKISKSSNKPEKDEDVEMADANKSDSNDDDVFDDDWLDDDWFDDDVKMSDEDDDDKSDKDEDKSDDDEDKSDKDKDKDLGNEEDILKRLVDLMKSLAAASAAIGGNPDPDDDYSLLDENTCDFVNYLDPTITFEKVGGLETYVSYLKNNVLFPLVEPDAMKEFDRRSPPKGILFYGVPGSGKTLMACALANELSTRLGKKVPFYYRKGPDTLTPRFGETNKLLQQLFKHAAKNKPSVIFFDEIDGLCPSRDRTSSGEAFTTVVTTLLGLMDEVVRGEVFVIAATNRIEAIDPALLRPGRFDKKLIFYTPNEEGRKRILDINLNKWDPSQRPPEAVVEEIVKSTIGFTGADLEKLVRDAFLKAFDRHAPFVQLDSDISELKVLPEDWFASVKEMTRTSTVSFGSSLYLPPAVPADTFSLLRNPAATILNDLSALRGKWNRSDIHLGMSAYLICDEKEKSGYMTDNLLVPHVLRDATFANSPVYIISEDTITNNENYLYAVDQALDSANSVLLISRIDRVIDNFPFQAYTLAWCLEKLKGKPCLIMATSCKDSLSLGMPAFQAIFNGSSAVFKVGNPKEEERRQFFHPVFQGNTFRAQNGSLDDTLAIRLTQLENTCIQGTASDSVVTLLNLFGKLTSCLSSYSLANKETLLNQLEDILQDHSLTN